MNLTSIIITESDNSTFFKLQCLKVFFLWTHMIRKSKVHDPTFPCLRTCYSYCTNTIITILIWCICSSSWDNLSWSNWFYNKWIMCTYTYISYPFGFPLSYFSFLKHSIFLNYLWFSVSNILVKYFDNDKENKAKIKNIIKQKIKFETNKAKSIIHTRTQAHALVHINTLKYIFQTSYIFHTKNILILEKF